MRLAKNAALNLSANLAMALSNWLLLIVVSKLHGDHALGEVALALSVLSPLFLFASFKLRTLVICDTQNEYPLEQYFQARFVANSLLLLSLPLLIQMLGVNVPWPIMLMIALYKWCDSWFELNISLRHRQQAFTRASGWMLSRAMFSIVTLVLCALLSLPLMATLGAWLLVTAAFAAVVTLYSQKQVVRDLGQGFSIVPALTGSGQLRRTFGLFRRYVTLSLALMCSSLFMYIPNLVIEHHMQVADAGRFAATSYFLVAGSLLITSFSQAAQPQLRYLHDKQTQRTFWALVFKLCLFGLLLGLVGVALAWVAGDWILSLVYSPAMTAMHEEFIWIMAAAMIRYAYIFIGTGLNAQKAFHVQTGIALVGTLVVLVLCLLWVPQSGTLGAAQAMFAATSSELALYMLFVFHQRQAVSQRALS